VKSRILSILFVLFVGVFALSNSNALACSACYGQSDSPMARGMNWGIFSLLGVIVTVLGCIAGFSIYLARRSAALSASQPANATHQSPT
jgi:hypothetical protein